MGKKWDSELVGTKSATLNINRAKLDATALTAERVQSLPDKAGTIAMLDDVSGVGTVIALQSFNRFSWTK